MDEIEILIMKGGKYEWNHGNTDTNGDEVMRMMASI